MRSLMAGPPWSYSESTGLHRGRRPRVLLPLVARRTKVLTFDEHGLVEPMSAGTATSSTLIVAELEGDTAIMTTQNDAIVVCRLPLVLLPPGIAPGMHADEGPQLCRFYFMHLHAHISLHGLHDESPAGQVVQIHASRSISAEEAREREVREIQAELLQRLGPAAAPTASAALVS